MNRKLPLSIAAPFALYAVLMLLMLAYAVRSVM
jgi:hypothetical protein